jgi:predicted 2-oxoglutarate/Fe(II)-dependent dioxygenase YbiX/peroxiredoxin
MTHLAPGDPAPWFTANTTSNPKFHFDAIGGYRIILSFLGSSKLEHSQQILQQFVALQPQLAALETPFFGVMIDPGDLSMQNLIHEPGYFKLIWDFDFNISALYGVCQKQKTSPSGNWSYTPTSFVLNQNMQVVQVIQTQEPELHVQLILNCIQSLPVFPPPQLANRQAPVLFIPHVFPAELCQHLIHLYEIDGGQDSGFMRQVDGKTVYIVDDSFKKRRDLLLEDPKLLEQVNGLILRRVKPAIEKAFQFSITRFERHLVACYEAHNQGFFNRHRDNTTKGTAHRRFAMTLNLNTGDYDGGCLCFPEYGAQLYRAEAGEAVIFSCSLLHEATPITAGRRFALLSFFYSDDDAAVRQQNLKYVETAEPVDHSAHDTARNPAEKPKGFQLKNKKSSKKQV